jgi:predicted DNA repair protein MutK
MRWSGRLSEQNDAMAGGLVGLLDDVAALAKLAAASIDDVGAAAGRASAKAAGVVVDDAAVTPAYVQGLAADRELPIIKRIATGSIRNKLLFILPVALLLSAVAPILVEIILMGGGTFLCYEGAHKIIHKIKGDDHDHDVPVAMQGPEAEEKTISGAIRTDFILSAEIMVIALKEVLDESVLQRGIVLVVVAIFITIVVYGVVALIVKMDDVGLSLAKRDSESTQRVGRALVAAMPKLLTLLTVVGTAAMLWVGGHILVVGAHELGWDLPYDIVHDAEKSVQDVGGIGGVLAWLVNTAISAVVGFVVGFITVQVIERVKPKNDDHAGAGGHADHTDHGIASH